jgi:hypothetical protein
MEDEPFDSRSGHRSNISALPPAAAFAHGASGNPVSPTGAAPTSMSARLTSPAPPPSFAFAHSEGRPSPPMESYGQFPQRWSQYEEGEGLPEVHVASPPTATNLSRKYIESYSDDAKRLGAATMAAQSVNPPKSYPPSVNMFGTPSPAKAGWTPGSVGSTNTGFPISFKRSESYDTAELIKKYASYQPVVPGVGAIPVSPMQSPQDQSIRNKAMQLLDIAEDQLKTPLNVTRTVSGGFRATPAEHNADYDVRRTLSGSITSAGQKMTLEEQRLFRESMGTVGANFSQPGRFSLRDPTFHDDDANMSDEEDDIITGQEVLDDLVDEMLDYDERRARDPLIDLARLSNRGVSSRIGLPQEPETDASDIWGTRHMYDWGTKQGVMTEMDRDRSRQMQTARNMLVSSAHSFKSAVEAQKGKVFGAGFAFRQNQVSGHMEDERPLNLRTSFNDEGDSHDLVSTTSRRTWQDALLNKKKRRRFLILLALLVCCIVVVTATIVRSKRHAERGTALGAAQNEQGTTVIFYATADVPYDADEEVKLMKDLDALPSDADFVIHLGNIQDASVSMCPATRYGDVASVLQKSPVTIFVVPGDEDWVQCPDPAAALANWKDAFDLFEDNFDHTFNVYRPRDRPEVFAMLHGGVLFVGLHIAGGDSLTVEYREPLELDMLKFYYGMLNLHKGLYRAVVLFGNARPGPSEQGFFDGLLASVGPVGLPFLYMNANSGLGVMSQYTPFPDYPDVKGIEIEDGGQNPPVRVTVGFGDRPFMVS